MFKLQGDYLETLSLFLSLSFSMLETNFSEGKYRYSRLQSFSSSIYVLWKKKGPSFEKLSLV